MLSHGFGEMMQMFREKPLRGENDRLEHRCIKTQGPGQPTAVSWKSELTDFSMEDFVGSSSYNWKKVFFLIMYIITPVLLNQPLGLRKKT